MTSIIISGPPAVGKTTVAKALADEFGLRYVSGGDVLKEMAKKEGFDSDGDDWWDTSQGMQFLQRRNEDPTFDKTVDDRLIEMYSGGGVVITSYTLPWLVDGGIKMWLAGSHQNSAKRMQNRDDIGQEEAYAVTKERYDKNKTLYRELYGFEFGDDLGRFDVVIDTDNLDAIQVIQQAKSKVRELL